ncbi:MAG: hypothetical protein RMJ60_05565 [Anaerolineales bacterium]|nr:hypothetical protein [Anaerolineales bacterium]
MLIKDLVHIDEHGAFRSDVQLSDYDDPQLNRDLLRNYIFTIRAPATSRAGRDFSAKDVLDTLKSAFALERFENRIVLTANFGRGKSHLALMLANFFSRPADSEEVRIIFERLGQALNNPAILNGYRDFKEAKGEFLVLRLRGDAFDDLQEGFLQALEQALSEHDCTRGIELPFWYAHAEAWLNSLRGETSQKAEAFLARYNTDLASLHQDLRKAGTYELIRETFKHLTGAYPDFGREVSLKDLVLWAIDKVCVPNEMGGLLVLFDEFSLFLQKYAASRVAGKLQELLNGISDRQGKSAFLAFSQIELESVLETYTQGTRRDDVRKELDRLPQDKRARLFSLMESVLDSYLKQDEAAWNAWLQRQPIRAAMFRNRETLYEYFPQRYNDILQWELEKTEQAIVKGCFPLHPLTTAILSSHTFEAGAGENARTALHFIRDRWEKGLPDWPAEQTDGTPSFVFAIELVDFFGAQISKKWYEAYRAALEDARFPLSEEHRAALKALMLQQSVDALDRKKTSGSDQLALLSALSGLPEQRLKDVLRKLSDNRVIEFDPYRKVSSLLPAGARSLEADKIIEEAVQKVPIDCTLLDDIAKSIPGLNVSQQFGHADDWAPRQVILTGEFFTTDTLKTLLMPYRTGPSGIEEGPRGLVVWLLTQTEEEKLRLRQSAQQVLDQSISATSDPPPVVIVLPKQPNPSLLQAARRKKALENLGRTEREKIGTIGYENETKRAKTDFELNFRMFIDPEHYADLPRQLHEFVLPSLYRASAEILKNTSLKNILSQVYRQAYAHRVEFYTQYTVGGKGPNKLREAVQKVALGLFSDAIGGSLASLGKQDIQSHITKNYLPRWGLLSPATYTIQPPNLLAMREAWNRLEETFPPGCKETRVRDVLLELLNPPYGHDYNTLTLLLAAWIGYRRHEIRISLAGQLVSLEKFKNYFDETKNPKDFLDRLSVTAPLAISRINLDETFAEVDAILEQIRQNQPFSLPQAQQALTKLEQVQVNSNLPPDRRQAISELVPRLQQAIEQAREYDKGVTSWQKEFSNADFDKLFTLRAQIEKLTLPALVVPNQSATEALLKEWETQLARETETHCRRYAQLSELSEYRTHEHILNKALRLLKEYPTLYSIAENALKELAGRRDELKKIENEKSIVAEIKGMAASAGLADLYRYQERLAEFRNLSPQTDKLCRDKASEIEKRIRELEQLAKELSQAIETVDSLDVLRQKHNLLLRNLDQTQGTPLHQVLTQFKERCEQLEDFFERLRELDNRPINSPQDLNSLEEQVMTIESVCGSWLNPAQAGLLARKKEQFANIRQKRYEESHRWLADLENRYRAGTKPHELLQSARMHPAFLSAEDESRLALLVQTLQRAVQEDDLLKIEALFRELTPEARRTCLQRLMALVDKP